MSMTIVSNSSRVLQLSQERLKTVGMHLFFGGGRGWGEGINRMHHGLVKIANTSRAPPTLSVNLSVICSVELIHLI